MAMGERRAFFAERCVSVGEDIKMVESSKLFKGFRRGF
jgi:hypothetical protein